MRVIYHCDDIGATPRITERILAAWRRGLLDSFSVMANGDGLDEMTAGLQAEPERTARIAVHLNLTDGQPTADPSSVALLTDGQGNLDLGFGGLVRFWISRSRRERAQLLEQVEREWRAQILAVRVACQPRPLSAVDGHIHVHMLPFLFPIAARLAREHGIPEIRVSQEPFHLSSLLVENTTPALIVNLLKHVTLRACARPARRVARRESLASPDAMIGVLYSGRMSAPAALAGVNAARRKGAGVVEVLFHIGRAAPEEAGRWSHNPASGVLPLSELRDREYAELETLRVKS